MSEEKQPLAGLGSKVYIISVEDAEKDPKVERFATDKPVSLLKPAMLTYEDDEPKDEKKGFSVGLNLTMEGPGPELTELLTRPGLFDVVLERKPGRMPRKMKKAYEWGWLYRRDTRWKRKAAAYRRRMMTTLHDAEIIVTREQRDRLAGMLDVEMTIHSGVPSAGLLLTGGKERYEEGKEGKI